MDKHEFKIIMEQTNGNLMTALENQILADMGGTREKANAVANHILDIIDAYKKFKNEKKIKINSISMKKITDYGRTYYRMYVDASTLPKWMYYMANVIDRRYGYFKLRNETLFELEGYISEDNKVDELSLVYYWDSYITITDIDNDKDEECRKIMEAFEKFALKYGSRLPDNGELALGDCEYIEKIPQELKDEWGL